MTERNPFDRLSESAGVRDRSARMVFMAMGIIGILLVILALPPFSILGGGSSSTFAPATGTTTVQGVDLPAVPEGFDVLSRHYMGLEAPDGTSGPYALTLDLLTPGADSRNLGLYTFRGGEWQRVSDATVTEDGGAVVGRAAEMPDNLAVLRRSVAAVQLSGRLPAVTRADPEALDVLDTVNPAGLSPAADGSVQGSQAAVPAGAVAVVPVVRATSEEEVQAVDSILASPGLRDTHIDALLGVSMENGNTGLELDYRAVSVARRADLVAFIGDLAGRLRQAGKTLSLVLPAPVRSGSTWDTQAYDWERLTSIADTVKILPERDPSLYYENMEGALEFLAPLVDLNRVHLVLSRNSIEKGAGELLQRPLLDALSLAASVDVRTSAPITPGTRVLVVATNLFEDDGATGLVWDENARAVAFSFPGVGGQRTVWLENSLSLAFRVDLARRFGLGGLSVEDMSLDPSAPEIWPVLDAYADTMSVDLVAPNSAMLRPSWQVEVGESDASSAGNVVWTAPDAPGSYEVALIVSDGVIRAQKRMSLEVLPPEPPAESAP